MITEFSQHPHPYPDEVQWRANCVHVTDGDTIIVRPDMGWEGTTHSVAVRVEGVDCPEMVGTDKPRGILAKARTSELVLHKPVLITTRRYRKTFDRYRAVVHYYLPDGSTQDLALTLIAEGHVKWPTTSP